MAPDTELPDAMSCLGKPKLVGSRQVPEFVAEPRLY